MESAGYFSAPESWASRLYNVLRPARPNSATPKVAKNCSRFRHSPGDIWKHTLSTAIYHDLSGTALEHTSMCAVTWRRFVRVEHIGLSGVVFYQILVPSSAPVLDDKRQFLTLENVFGDLEDPSVPGMDLDDLLDAVDAKMVYFPAYACTSFTIGQVMSAYLLEQPMHRPRPAFRGFSVCMGESNTTPLFPPSDIRTPENVDIGDYNEDCSAQKAALSPLRRFSASLLEILSLETDNPYISLCVRSSSLDTSDSSGTREDSESVTSTVDSTGPPTPPSSARQSKSQIKTMQSLYSYDDLLSFLDLSLDDYED